MIEQHDAYEIDDDAERFDISRVQKWLATTYWWGDTASLEMVKRCFANSALVIGAYCKNEQVACARLVSDKTRFAWLADVYVDPAHRRKGLARAMVRFALAHPDYQTVSRIVLATRDAHGVYAELGFATPQDPNSIMQLRRDYT